jgi:hypothetical protein
VLNDSLCLPREVWTRSDTPCTQIAVQTSSEQSTIRHPQHTVALVIKIVELILLWSLIHNHYPSVDHGLLHQLEVTSVDHVTPTNTTVKIGCPLRVAVVTMKDHLDQTTTKVAT